MIVGMLKVDYFQFVETFEEEASTTIETSIKQTVIECLSNEDTFIFKNSLPFDQLNELDYHKWLNVLNQIFENLYIVLKRIQTIHIVIGRTINKFELNLKSKCEQQSSAESSKNSKLNGLLEDTKDNQNSTGANFFDSNEDNQDDNRDDNQENNANDEKESKKSELANKFDKCLFKICRFCHIKCSEIINSKIKDNYFISRVSFDEYRKLIKLTEKFTRSNETICSEKIPQLKLALGILTNKYISKFHNDQTKSILSLLDIEQWKPFDQISPDFQQIINDLIDYTYSFSEIHRLRKQVQTNKTKNQQQANLKYLEVNGEKFVIVYTIISFVYTIIEYCSIAAETRSIAPDLLNRLVELFKKFNSKVMKLVLMAEG